MAVPRHSDCRRNEPPLAKTERHAAGTRADAIRRGLATPGRKSVMWNTLLQSAAVLCAMGLPMAAAAQDRADLALKLANPLAAIISVPFQLNYDDNIGAEDAGNRTTLNLQPVIPFALDNGANIITRTIIPYIWQDDVIPGTSQSGFGDILASAWYARTTPTNLTWGVGPAVRFPTFSDVSGDTWAAGVTAIVLQQSGPWTFGGLANHLWDLESSPETPVNATFVQPFVAYTTPTAWTVSLQSESTYDWVTSDWSVPVNATLSKLTAFGDTPVNLQAGFGYWLKGPDSGPEGWRFRLQAQFVLQRG